MNEVLNFLTENPVVYFSTIGEDGTPKVRPFQFMLEENGKLYFCTSNKKDVYAQIKNNPSVEISVMSKQMAWIRLKGKVVFSDNMDIKTKIINGSGLVRSIYQTPDNPVFEIFYLENAEATIADFSGNPPKSYKL
jgi:uncharacterized pyridoxamine 5'-phosphate oxidase family protein